MVLFKKFGQKIKQLFQGRALDDEFFDDLEDTLIEGDLGSRLTEEISSELREMAKKEKDLSPSDLQKRMKELLSRYIRTLDIDLDGGPSVFMILGVNGVGKTTTIAKLAHYYSKQGKKVLLAAGDTYRAAAIEQLEIHAQKLGIRIVKHEQGADPAAVVYDAITSAVAHGEDLVLADTAGRMHNKENLMKELKKIDKIIRARGIRDENYYRFLVVDATTGQNGVSQAMLFNEAVGLSGIILTKYDSLAKGGSLVQIGKQLSIPIIFVCTGESYDDMKPFDKEEFLDSLVGLES